MNEVDQAIVKRDWNDPAYCAWVKEQSRLATAVLTMCRVSVYLKPVLDAGHDDIVHAYLAPWECLDACKALVGAIGNKACFVVLRLGDSMVQWDTKLKGSAGWTRRERRGE